MRTWTVGTRRSLLATTQTGQVLAALQAARPQDQFVIKEIITKGDQIQDVALAQMGGKGLFVSEIEAALLDESIDFAVHSMKDVPAVLASGLAIGATPRREDPRDLLVSEQGYHLHTLPKGAVVGTSSLRRTSQLLALRPDLRIATLRGNIDTRLHKLAQLDAIVLAAAGLARMGWWDGERFANKQLRVHAAPLSLNDVVPAVGQGALAVECRATDEDTNGLLRVIHDLDTDVCVAQERAFLACVGGSCQVPVGAYAVVDRVSKILTLTGMVGAPGGEKVVRSRLLGEPGDLLGQKLAEKLLEDGGRVILDSLSHKSQ